MLYRDPSLPGNTLFADRQVFRSCLKGPPAPGLSPAAPITRVAFSSVISSHIGPGPRRSLGPVTRGLEATGAAAVKRRRTPQSVTTILCSSRWHCVVCFLVPQVLANRDPYRLTEHAIPLERQSRMRGATFSWGAEGWEPRKGQLLPRRSVLGEEEPRTQTPGILFTFTAAEARIM